MFQHLISNKIVRQIIIYIPGSVIPAFITLATSSIFTRVFSVSDYGRFSLFFVLGTITRMLLTQWIMQSTGRYLPEKRDDEEKLEIKTTLASGLWIVFIIEIILGAIAMIFVKPFFDITWQSFFAPTICYIIISSFFDSYINIFPAEMKAREFVYYRFFESLSTFVLRLLFVFVIFHMDVKIMLWSVVISNGLLVPILWRRGKIPFLINIFNHQKRVSIKNGLKVSCLYGMPMTIFYFTNYFLDVGDRYLIQLMLSTNDVGIYDANYRIIVGGVMLIVMPLSFAINPYLIQAARDNDIDKIGRTIQLVTENLTIAGLLGVGILVIFHADFAYILLGKDFRQGSMIMPIVLAGVLVCNMGNFTHKPFEIAGKTMVILYWGIISVIVNIIANIILLPLVGYIGAAYATLLAYSVYFFFISYLGKKIIPWSINKIMILKWSLFICGGVAFIIFIRNIIEGVSSYLPGLFIALILAFLMGIVTMLHLIKMTLVFIKK